MEERRVSAQDYRRIVLAYRGLPVVTALVLVVIFLAVFAVTRSYVPSILAAAPPSLLLIWRWVLAGKQIDRRGCPKCGNPFPKNLYWTYPPKICPGCGERLHR
jgi:hypothetical protein